MIIGRVVGTLLGWLAFRHILGAVLGFIAGLYFDRALGRTLAGGAGGKLDERLKPLFMQLLFTSLGHLAKADGRVSQAEIDHTEQIISQMGLDAEGRKQAIQWFQQGAKKEQDYRALLDEFVHLSGNRPGLRRMLLEMLVQLTLADGRIEPGEEVVLIDIAAALGVPKAAFRLLLEQIKAQQHFQQQRAGEVQGDALADAYQALGVSEDDSDQTIKKAWRKLMSEHHPDKLIAQGVPDAAVREATERSQVIQAAYDMIKKHRKKR